MKLSDVTVMKKNLLIEWEIAVVIREVMYDVRIVLLSINVRFGESVIKLSMVKVYIITI
jgi:hypothetical protein